MTDETVSPRPHRALLAGVLQDVRVVIAGGTAVLVAAVLVLFVRTDDPATADTLLSGVRAAAVELPDGSVVDARDGMVVPAGARVRTGATGGAVLETQGRAVLLGALTTVRLADGVHQSLERGQVLVDAKDGPRLELGTRAGLAAVPEGGQARVETGPVLRLGVFRKEASLTSPGRQATTTVQDLHQMLAPYAGRPGSPTALALLDDEWEERIAPDLVTADRDLKALARGLSGATATNVLQAAPIALRSVPPTTADPGEQALSVALAQASRLDSSVDDTLRRVQSLRAEGGSWGVVAALVRARVTAVSAVLDGVLSPGSAPPPVQAGDQPDLPGLLGSTPSPSASRSGSGGPPRPTRTQASPTRTPTTSPPTTGPTPVNDLVTQIGGILSASPSPILPVGGLLR